MEEWSKFDWQVMLNLQPRLAILQLQFNCNYLKPTPSIWCLMFWCCEKKIQKLACSGQNVPDELLDCMKHFPKKVYTNTAVPHRLTRQLMGFTQGRSPPVETTKTLEWQIISTTWRKINKPNDKQAMKVVTFLCHTCVWDALTSVQQSQSIYFGSCFKPNKNRANILDFITWINYIRLTSSDICYRFSLQSLLLLPSSLLLYVR